MIIAYLNFGNNLCFQGSRLDGNLPFPLHGHPSTPTHQVEMLHGRQSDGANVNLPIEQTNLTRKIRDKDDCSVPVFVQSRMDLGHSKTQIVSDKEKLTPISSPHFGHLVKIKNAAKKDPKQISSPTLNLRREVNASPNQEDAECSVPGFNRLAESDACLQQESRSGSQPNVTGLGDGLVESSRDVEKGTVSRERSVSCSRADPSSPDEPDNDSEYRGDRACISPQMGHVDKSDDVSETSMVDSISGMDISPDDVVGIIGQKHFWTARKAIVK